MPQELSKRPTTTRAFCDTLTRLVVLQPHYVQLLLLEALNFYGRHLSPYRKYTHRVVFQLRRRQSPPTIPSSNKW